MAAFNVMEATRFSYRLVWRERRYFLYLAAIPCLIELICHMTVVMLGWRSMFMRQALIMLPSYFAYGWMLSHVARLVFLDQRWPFRSTGNVERDRRELDERARHILAGMLSFVVVEFLLAGFMDGLYQLNTMPAPETAAAPSFPAAMIMAVFAGGLVWLFRYFWFYIPVSVGYPLPEFSMSMKGYGTSFYMMVVWLTCTAPVTMIYFFFVSTFVPVSPDGVPFTWSGEFIGAFTAALANTTIAILTTAGMAYGIRSMISTFQKNH